MPESLLESGSEFDRKKILLGRWLRENADSTRVLTQDELGGSSIAEALRRPKTADAAWRILASIGA